MATLYETLGDKYTAYGTPERTKLAADAGIANYTGSAEQNAQLVSYLNKPTATTTKPVNSVVTPSGTTNIYNPATGSYSSGTPDYLAGVQKNIANSSSEIRNDIKIADNTGTNFNITPTTSYNDYKTNIQPSIDKPVAPNYVDKYTQLRADQGIPALEDSIGQYDAQKAYLLANLDKFKRNELSGQPLGFAQGRISTEQQGIQDQLDFIDRQENLAIDKLNTKTKFIENIMNLTKDDYSTATDNYNTQFNQNMQIQSSLSTEKNQARDDARATLTTINNMVSNSGKSYDELDPVMKANINSLELQSGMPVGTFATFAASKPKANIISTTTGTDANGNDFVSFISKDPTTGEMSVDKMFTGGKSSIPGSTTKNTPNQIKASIDDTLAKNNAFGADGKVSYETYIWMNQNYINNGGTQAEFTINYPITTYLDGDNQSLYLNAIQK